MGRAFQIILMDPKILNRAEQVDIVTNATCWPGVSASPIIDDMAVACSCAGGYASNFDCLSLSAALSYRYFVGTALSPRCARRYARSVDA